MTRTPDYTDYRYLGKEGKQHVVTNGLSTRFLSNREFREFSRQLFNR